MQDSITDFSIKVSYGQPSDSERRVDFTSRLKIGLLAIKTRLIGSSCIKRKKEITQH